MQHKSLTFPLRLSLIILIFGALFKIMHLPYANYLMLIGGLLIGLLYTIRFFSKTNKVRLDAVKLVMVLLWVINYLNDAFHLINLYYVLEITLFILFMYWFSVEGISYFKNRTYKKHKALKAFNYVLILIIICSLCFGIIFKIQHWPYGNIMFTIGILLLCVWLIFDYYIIDRTTKNEL